MSQIDSDKAVDSAIKAYLLEATDLPVLNISQVGLSLETNAPFIIGQHYVLNLKSRAQKVLMDGMVVRCRLNELAETMTGTQLPLYHNGFEFQIERNPKETRLLNILQDNLYGEKRLGASRIKPMHKLVADVGRPCFTAVKKLEKTGMLVEGPELLDMDEMWPVLLQNGEDGVELDCHIVLGSRKDGSSNYLMLLEFLNLTDHEMQFLDNAVEVF